MSDNPMLHLVIDTNVVLEGLTKQGSAPGLIIDAWLAGVFKAYVSNALAHEYRDVLSRKLSISRWQNLQPVLGTLLNRSEFTKIYYSWRPTSPDPGDDLVIDCAMNANAIVVTANIRDFESAKKSLGLKVITPTQLILQITTGESLI
jgi:predicted nucleic acid-binding protein